MDKKNHPFHALLFAIYPALFLYGANVSQVVPADVLPSIAALFVLCAACYFSLRLLLRDPLKAGIITSLFFFLFFSYSHLHKIAVRIPAFGGVFMRHRAMCALLFIIFCAAAALVMRTKRNLRPATSLLNFMAVVLVVMSAARIGASLFHGTEWLDARRAELAAASRDKAAPGDRSPDIYYIIFDRYAGSRSLEEFWGFDNSDLTGYLESKGFFVAGESVCNYTSTGRSLASSLNMQHLDFITGEVSRQKWPPNVETLMIRDNKVLRMLKARGYYYVYVSSPFWSVSTRVDRKADKKYYRGIHLYLDEFSMMLFRNTPFYPFHSKSIMKQEQQKNEIIRDNIDSLTDAARIKESPKFVMAHLLIPHPPFVFMRDGSPMSNETLLRIGPKRAYIENVIYTNGQIKRIVDEIMKSPRKPVIILQSDEGPFPEDVGLPGSAWGRIKCRNLNALYLPGITPEQRRRLYPGMSPVNNFRTVFNFYFGKDYPMLPDTCRRPVVKDGVVRFNDYTGEAKR